MRNIIHNGNFLFLLLVVCMSAGCKKSFLDINKDPNRVTDDNVTPELIFPAAAEGAGARMVGLRASAAGATSDNQFAQNWIGYMAPNGDFVPPATENTYALNFGFNDNLFVSYYGVLFDLHQTEIKGLAGNDTTIAAASIILSAKLFQELVDLFGDIPYSQAFKDAQTTHPAYDKAQAIYQSLQLRLDTAITYMGLSKASGFTAADIVNKGDQQKWIKFANTLKLRLLIRQSEIAGFNPSAEIAKIFKAGGPGILGAGESVSENPGYANTVDQQNPYYAQYGYTPTGTKASTSTNANVYIINILNSNNDPRIGQFFLPVGNSYVGNLYGDLAGNLSSGANSSYFGPALVGSASQDQWLLPSYESLFLYAEAVARGWVPGVTDAKTAYMNAVTESFVWLKVGGSAAAAATAANDYMTNSAIANWANAGASVQSQVKFIAFQKYIANTCIDPFESYADERRLYFLPPGFISVSPSRVNNTSILPLRMLYPQSEYTSNADNVNKEGTIDPFKTKLFWEP